MVLQLKVLDGPLKTPVWYLAPTWWLRTICNSNSRGLSFLFWPPQTHKCPGWTYINVGKHSHTYNKNKCIFKAKWTCNFQRYADRNNFDIHNKNSEEAIVVFANASLFYIWLPELSSKFQAFPLIMKNHFRKVALFIDDTDGLSFQTWMCHKFKKKESG